MPVKMVIIKNSHVGQQVADLQARVLAAENARLRRENQELRDTNELLKAASAFFASEPGPKRRK